jgi:peptidoglycan biosynthesis protein MviN/MurJ (putative lipid II flippase)
MRTTLAQAVINLVLSVVLVWFFGYFGAVIGTVTATIFGGILFFGTYGKRLMPAPLRSLVSLTYRPVLAVLPAGLLGILTAEACTLLPLAAGRLSAGIALGSGGLVFMIVYLAVVRLSGALTADDLGFFRNALPEKALRVFGLR